MRSGAQRIYHTFGDLQSMANLAAIGLRVAYPGRIVVLITLPMRHGLWMGSAMARRVVERAGGLPVPVGAGPPADTLMSMRRFEPNAVESSPTQK